MGDSAGHKHKHLEFTLAVVSELSSSSSVSSSSSSSTPVIARFSADDGVAELRFHQGSEFIDGFNVDLGTSQVSERGSCLVLEKIVMKYVIVGFYGLNKNEKQRTSIVFCLTNVYVFLYHWRAAQGFSFVFFVIITIFILGIVFLLMKNGEVEN